MLIRPNTNFSLHNLRREKQKFRLKPSLKRCDVTSDEMKREVNLSPEIELSYRITPLNVLLSMMEKKNKQRET